MAVNTADSAAPAAVRHHVRPVLNQDREEIRVPSPYGGELLAFLSRHGLRAGTRTDAAGDVLMLQGEPDMGRVKRLLADWEKTSAC